MAELVIYFFPVFSATLEKGREVALSSGLEYVYIGNVPGHEGENTSIARRTVENYIRTRSVPKVDPTTLSNALKIPCGAFVTLSKRGTLRGCIGRFDASEPLYKVVLEMAVASANQDYRLSFLLLFFLTPAKFSMGTLLSPYQECHPFLSSSLAYDLVVSPLLKDGMLSWRNENQNSRIDNFLSSCMNSIDIISSVDGGRGWLTVY